MQRHAIWASLALAAATHTAWADNEGTPLGQAIQASGQTSANVSGAAANAIAVSGQATSAILAVPLSIGGAALESAGTVSTEAARESMRAATSPIGTPLPVTDEVLTVIPPNQALKTQAPAKNP